jgi:flagellar motor switch protein FliN/FliY
VNTQTDLAVLSPAAAEAASLLAGELGLEGEAGQCVDLWGPDGGGLTALLSKDAQVWSAALAGPSGLCGEIAFVLPAGAAAPEESQLAAALAACVPALSEACGAKEVGELERPAPDVLLEPRPGQKALAVPFVSGKAHAGAMVIITPVGKVAVELPHLDPVPGPPAGQRSIADLGDVEMSVSVELGKTRIPIRDLLNIHNGAVVQLDRSVNHPVDVFVNGTLIARGEVVVVDECFGVRVTELITGD